MDSSRVAWIASTAIGSCLVVAVLIDTTWSGSQPLAHARESGAVRLDPRDPALHQDALCAIEMFTDREVRDLEIAVYDERELLRIAPLAALPQHLPTPLASRSLAVLPARQAAIVRDIGYGRKLVEIKAATPDGARLQARPAWVYVHDGLGAVAQRIEWRDAPRRTLRALTEAGDPVARRELLVLGATLNSSAEVVTADDGTFECAAGDSIVISRGETPLCGVAHAENESDALVLRAGDPRERLAMDELPAPPSMNTRELHPWDLGSPLRQAIRALASRVAASSEAPIAWIDRPEPLRSRPLDEMRAGDSLHTFVASDLPVRGALNDGLLIVRTNRTYERVTVTDLRGMELVRGISDRYGELVLTGLPGTPVLVFSATWSGDRTRTSGTIPGSDTELWLADLAAPPIAADRSDVLGFVADSQGRPIGGGSIIAQFYPRPGHFGHRTDSVSTRGYFRLSDLPAGDAVDVMLRDPPGRGGAYRFLNYRSRRIVPSGGRENVLSFVLDSGGIDVRVSEAVASTGGARFELRKEGEDEMILARRLATDARRLEVLGLTAGRYLARIEGADGDIALDEVVTVLEATDNTEPAKQGG